MRTSNVLCPCWELLIPHFSPISASLWRLVSNRGYYRLSSTETNRLSGIVGGGILRKLLITWEGLDAYIVHERLIVASGLLFVDWPASENVTCSGKFNENSLLLSLLKIVGTCHHITLSGRATCGGDPGEGAGDHEVEAQSDWAETGARPETQLWEVCWLFSMLFNSSLLVESILVEAFAALWVDRGGFISRSERTIVSYLFGYGLVPDA